MDALIEATAAPHVRLQIVPFDAGGHAAAGGAFTILRFGDQDLPDIVYIEQLTSAIYLDKREDLDYYALGHGAALRGGRAAGADPRAARAASRDELYPR